MKLIIAGSRHYSPYQAQSLVETEINALFPRIWPITEVISGTAKGIDKAGEKWAKSNKIPIRKFPADWETYGRAAGPMRNKAMAQYADAAIVIWDGKSRGSANMIREAKTAGIDIISIKITPLENDSQTE